MEENDTVLLKYSIQNFQDSITLVHFHLPKNVLRLRVGGFDSAIRFNGDLDFHPTEFQSIRRLLVVADILYHARK